MGASTDMKHVLWMARVEPHLSVTDVYCMAQAIGVFARVLPHVPANKSQRRDGSPCDGHVDGVVEASFHVRSSPNTSFVPALSK
ncbi:hypothetical protein HaLaN_02786, partial [Haematococcus lacustris]